MWGHSCLQAKQAWGQGDSFMVSLEFTLQSAEDVALGCRQRQQRS